MNMAFFSTLVTVIGSEYSAHWQDKRRYGMLETARLYADYMDMGYVHIRVPDEPFVYVATLTSEKQLEDKVEEF
jgi:hypothetical protein